MGGKLRTALLDLDHIASIKKRLAGSFGAVFLFDILEHTGDDQAVLKAVRPHVRRRVFINVPRETPAELREKGLLFGAYQDLGHRRYYDEESLARLARKAGFKVLHLEPLNEYAPQAFMPLLFEPKHLPSRIISRLLYGRTRLVRYRRFWNSVAAVLAP